MTIFLVMWKSKSGGSGITYSRDTKQAAEIAMHELERREKVSRREYDYYIVESETWKEPVE